MANKKSRKRAGRETELELSRRKAKNNRLVIISAVIVAIIGVSIYFAMFAGNGGSTQNNQPIKATWIEPQILGDTVSIPVSEVESNWNVHFNLKTQGEDMNFMAYVLDGETHVRANVCPPCWSTGFSLEEAVLICDRCATTFGARTGEGIEGACVDFPKASVPYEVSNGNIVMNHTDLVAAYEDTIEPGGSQITIEDLIVTADHQYLKETATGYKVGKIKEYGIECIASNTSGELVYEWLCDAGEIFGEGSMITWTAPDVSIEVTIMAVVTDVAGNTVSESIILNVVRCSACIFG